MGSLFEALQFEVRPLADDLHYEVRDPTTGEALANVRPIAVGRWRQQEEGTFKRFSRTFLGMPFSSAGRYHVPRVVLEVSDLQGSPLLYVDRSEKLVGHPCVPNSAVVSPKDGLVGYFTTDHDKALTPLAGTVDSDGMTQVSGRAHVRDATFEVACDIVMRLGLRAKPMQLEDYDGVESIRLVGKDGTVWAKMIGMREPVFQHAPNMPPRLKVLLTAFMLYRELDERLHVKPFARFIPSFTPPEPVDPGYEPYPGYSDVHTSYLSYQKEFIEQYRKRKQGIRKRAAGAA